MTKADCFQLGWFTRVYGLQGHLKAILLGDNPKQFAKTQSLFVETKAGFMTYQVDAFQIKSANEAIIKLKNITTPNQAEYLERAAFYLPLTALPQLDEEQFYYHEIIGFEVIDSELGSVGTVTEVYEAPAQDVLAFNHHGHEVLAPITHAIFPRVNRAERKLYANLPSGLLEVYTTLEQDAD